MSQACKSLFLVLFLVGTISLFLVLFLIGTISSWKSCYCGQPSTFEFESHRHINNLSFFNLHEMKKKSPIYFKFPISKLCPFISHLFDDSTTKAGAEKENLFAASLLIQGPKIFSLILCQGQMGGKEKSRGYRNLTSEAR